MNGGPDVPRGTGLAAVAAPFGRDVEDCFGTIERALGLARAAGSHLVAFPESALGGPPGIPSPGADPRPVAIGLDGPEIARLRELAGETVVCVGVSERARTGVYSTAVCLSGAGIHGTHRKVHIPPSELRAYCAGESFTAFDTPVGRIGMLNCYDKVFPEAARALALQGAETIVALSAWPACRYSPAPVLADDVQSLHFDLMDRARAVENQVHWVASNLSGPFGELRFLGQAKVVDPDGRILGATEPGVEGVASGVATEAARRPAGQRAISHLRDRRPDAYGPLPSYGAAVA